MRKRQTIQARMKVRLDSLGYDFSRFTLEGFADWLAQERGRPIVFVPRSMPASISGGWLKSAVQDYIFYDVDTPTVRQAHIQLHEMSHMLCGHSTAEIGPQQVQALLRHTTPVDPSAFESLLRRSAHSDEAEKEAEELASLIQTKAVRYNRLVELTKAIPCRAVLASYMEALGALEV